MTHLRILLIAAACLAATAEIPAFALNPQPLPPGMKSQYHTQVQTHQTTARFSSGQHIPK